MPAYIVYELQPTRSRRDRDEVLGERLPVKNQLHLVGCFVADDEHQACRAAAASQSRSAFYVAHKVKVEQAQFSQVEGEGLKALAGVEPDEREELRDSLKALQEGMTEIAQAMRRIAER